MSEFLTTVDINSNVIKTTEASRSVVHDIKSQWNNEIRKIPAVLDMHHQIAQ